MWAYSFLNNGWFLPIEFRSCKLHFDRSNIIRNFKIIYPRNFVPCCVELLYIQTYNNKERQIDYNILNILYFKLVSGLFSTKYTREFCGYSLITALLVVESITRQWNIEISFIRALFIYFFFREDELDPKSNDTLSNTFQSQFLMTN